MKIRQNQINWILAASTLAVIGLLMLQVQWMRHSKKLIEEQFNNKVSMAMCMAVTSLGDGPKGCLGPDPVVDNKEQDMSTVITDMFNPRPSSITESEVRGAIEESLAFYDILIPFEVAIIDNEKICGDINQPGCCSMQTVAGFENYLLHISFPGKTGYILKKMGLMLLASVVLLLFIATVFIKANQYLLRQKRIGEQNKDFFNNMAHEFKTPLTNIHLATSLVGKKDPSAATNKYLGIIKKESGKLMDQVERVLYLASLEKQEHPMQKERIPVRDLIHEIRDSLSIQIQEKKGRVTLDIPASLKLEGDRFHLGNAFRNILENAIKYSDRPPEIVVTSEVNQEHIAILFKDNGVGISKSDQELIFEKFKRVHSDDVHNVKGFGLGLAYVKKVVELHKGFITIMSDLQKGSRFSLHFPV